MTRISLHCGLNRVDPEAYAGWPGYLVACCADATDMAALMARAGFSATALYNQNVTSATLLLSIKAASKLLIPGDTFLLTYSGHGAQRDSAWSGATTESLCLYDGLLDDQTLRAALGQFATGVNVMLAFDSCHSGGMDRAPSRARVAPLWVTRNSRRCPFLPDSSADSAPNILLLAACDANETAEDGDRNGAFTGSLLASADGGRQSWSELFAKLATTMDRYFPAQHPKIIRVAGQSFANTPIFA